MAITAALMWYILCDPSRGSLVRRAMLAIVYLPVGAWGLLAYMGYQYVEFGNPLAFAQTQEHWTFGIPYHPEPGEKLESLLALEPIWGCYDPDSLRYWKRHGESPNIFFNLLFWNPILFVWALFLVLLGAFKSWLSGTEVVLGLGLLAIPYITRAYEMSMASHARFAAVVIPAYIVMGRLLQSCPPWGFWCYCVVCSCLLMLWSALFAAGHLFF